MTAQRLKFIGRCIFSGILIWLVLRKLDWSALGNVLIHAQWRWVALGWASASLLVLGLAPRWRIFLRAQGIDLSFGMIFSLTWAGQFFNSVLPGSTGGDVVKVYQLCRLVPDRKAAATATVIVDRFVALAALIVLAVMAFTIEPTPLLLFWRSVSFGAKLPWLVLAAGLGIAAGGFLILRLRATVWGGRLVRTINAAKRNLSLDRRLIVAFGLAFTMHFVNIAIAYFFARALGTSLTFLQILTILPAVSVLVMLPVTINGHGLREWLFIGYFTQLGVTISGHPESGVKEIAVALSLLLVANDLLWSLPGGLWYFAKFKSAPNALDASTGA
jgi:uncharacterized protein (TIRG00374 family)